MASTSQTDPPTFTFILEYLTSAMAIRTVRPASYSTLRLCNIAALVLQKTESPIIHNFHPKAVIPWAGRVVDVSTDERLNKVVQLCIMNGQYALHIAVMFDARPPYGRTDRHVLTRLLSPRDEDSGRTDAMEHVADDATAGTGKQMASQATEVVKAKKRKYRCTLCKADGHQKRTCKIVKPTPTVGPFNENALTLEIRNGTEDNHSPVTDQAVNGTGLIPV